MWERASVYQNGEYTIRRMCVCIDEVLLWFSRHVVGSSFWSMVVLEITTELGKMWFGGDTLFISRPGNLRLFTIMASMTRTGSGVIL